MLKSRRRFRQYWPALAIIGILVLEIIFISISLNIDVFDPQPISIIYPLFIIADATSSWFALIALIASAILPVLIFNDERSYLTFIITVTLFTIVLSVILSTATPIIIMLVIIIPLFIILISESIIRLNIKLLMIELGKILGLASMMTLMAYLALFCYLNFEFTAFQHQASAGFEQNQYHAAVKESRFKWAEQRVSVYKCGFLGIYCYEIFISDLYGGGEPDLPENIALINDQQQNILYLQLNSRKIQIAP
jgi:hypothetical protein